MPASIGFAIGGGGWLTTWYLGVVEALVAAGAIVPGVTPVTGVSTGAQAAAAACGGANFTAGVQFALAQAARCEAWPTRPKCKGELHSVITGALEASLPPDAAEKCRSVLTLGLSRARVSRNGKRLTPAGGYYLTGDEFTDRADLIQGVGAAGYLTCMSGDTPFMTYKGRPTIAGGYSIKRNFVCPKGVEKCIVVHSAREGPLFRHSRHRRRQLRASAAAGEGGFSSSTSTSSGGGSGFGNGGFGGGGRRTLKAGGCNITAPKPLVHWTNKEYNMVQIYPGKWSQVDMMFYQWENMAVDWPSYAGLKHAYENGKLDGAAWAKEALGLVAPAAAGAR